MQSWPPPSPRTAGSTHKDLTVDEEQTHADDQHEGQDLKGGDDGLEEPEKNMPRGLVLTAVVVLALYAGLTIVASGLLTIDELAHEGQDLKGGDDGLEGAAALHRAQVHEHEEDDSRHGDAPTAGLPQM